MTQKAATQTKQAVKATALPPGGMLLQRACACGQHTPGGGECAECRSKGDKNLQRSAAGPAHPTVPPIVHDVLRSPGHPLDGSTRSFLEPRFGRDFSGVRVHTDDRAAQSATLMNARAYTVGQDIVFAAGSYSPGTMDGRRLMAHELTHTVQQSPGPALSPIGVSDPDGPLEREAENVAATVVGLPDDVRASSPVISVSGDSIGRHVQRQAGEPTDKVKATCAELCRTLDSMRNTVDAICRLSGGEDTEKCKSNRATAANNAKRIADAGCKCAGAVVENAVPVCSTTYAKATSFQQLIDLVRAAETKLSSAGITSPKDQIHALRGIYYGTTWSQDYAVEKSTTRNEGFQRFTRPSQAPDHSIPTDISATLNCGLFTALMLSQDVVDGSRHVDFGHLIIGLDARNDPKFTSNIKYPGPMGIDIDLGGTGTELVTWLGDLGGGAANLASKRVSAPGTNVSASFTGSDYGGSINLEGDVAASVVATANPTTLTAPTFPAGKKLSDALQDYLSPGTPGAAWKGRATTFLKMIGGVIDASGALTNRAALVTSLSDKIQTFACNYLASRVKDSHISYKTAKAAADHVIPASGEVAETFVDALVDSHKTGDKIEAKRFPSPKASTGGACKAQLAAASLLNVFGN